MARKLEELGLSNLEGLVGALFGYISWLFVQGTTGYGWPWGNELDDTKMPEFTSGNTLPLAEPVTRTIK